MLIFVAKILWSTTHAPQNAYFGAPQKRFSLLVLSIVANAARVTEKRTDVMTEKWSRPEPRQVKLNVDASFYDDLKAGATGAVLRDYKGEFIAASSTYIPHVPSAIMAESHAMKEGLA
jgi:hypothetical protein